jgi:hypothetical protein
MGQDHIALGIKRYEMTLRKYLREYRRPEELN